MTLGNGEALSFWTDPWLQGTRVADIVQELMTTVAPRRRKRRSVACALCDNSWRRDITGALTVPVLLQYLDIWQHLQQVQLRPEVADSFTWRWEVSSAYSCRSSYMALCNGQTSILGAMELWKTHALRKCIFFMWFAILGRCWMSERCHRHGFHNSADCALCTHHSELLDLLLGCSFAREVWHATLNRCGWLNQVPTATDLITNWWLRVSKQTAKAWCKVFDLLVHCVVWCVWREQNERVFRGSTKTARCGKKLHAVGNIATVVSSRVCGQVDVTRRVDFDQVTSACPTSYPCHIVFFLNMKHECTHGLSYRYTLAGKIIVACSVFLSPRQQIPTVCGSD
jgi:hypothetical protein